MLDVPDKSRLCFVVIGRNCRGCAAACLDSLLAQQSTCWTSVVVDDGSDDGTRDILASYQRRYPDRFALTLNERRLFKAESFTRAMKRLPPNAIVAELDLDDSLHDPSAVDDVLTLHRFYDVVWTQHRTINRTSRPWDTWRSTPLPRGWSRATAEGDRVWSKDYFPGHMRTFKKYLFDALDLNALLFDGQPLRVAFDMAYYTAIIESVPHAALCFYDQPIYTYNVWDHNDEFRETALARAGTKALHRVWCQSEMDRWFKQLPIANRLDVRRDTATLNDCRVVTHTLSSSGEALTFVFENDQAAGTASVLGRCVVDRLPDADPAVAPADPA